MRLVITYPFPLDQVGGGTIGCLEIARGLQGAGHDVSIVSVGDGVPLIPIPEISVYAASRTLGHHFLSVPYVAKLLRSLHRSAPIDAVISFAWEGAAVQVALPHVRRVMVASALYADWYRRPRRWRQRIADRGFVRGPLRRSAVVLAPSQATLEELVTVVGVERALIKVSPWGIDPVFGDVTRTISASGPPKRILFFGSLEAVKGVDDAIAAFAAARPNLLDSKLRIIGGPPHNRVREAAERSGLRPTEYSVIPAVHRPELLRHLEWADVALLPSRAESFGLAIAEAAASGLPVVTWHVGSTPEILRGPLGEFSAPLGDVPALADRLVRACSSHAARLAVEARPEILARYRWERTVAAVESACQRDQALNVRGCT